MDIEQVLADLPRLCVDVTPIVETGEGASNSLGAVVVRGDYLWDNGKVIDYSYLDGEFSGTAFQQQTVDDVIKQWERYANVTFNKTADPKADIRVSFNPKTGSYSAIGIAAKDPSRDGQATLNLGWIKEGAEFTNENRGVTLHEFGHALGLLHEHQSPARGGKLTLKDAAIILAYGKPPNNWDPAKVKSQVLDVYNKQLVSNYSEVDLDSIMMYDMPAAFNTQGINIPRHFDLSDLDKAYMIVNYPRPNPSPESPQWTVEHALKVAKVDAKTSETILQFWKSGDWKSVRRTFNAWNAIMQAVGANLA